MSYQSIKFVLFSGIVLLAFYGPGRKHQKVVLALANLCFYVFAGIQYLPFLLATTLVTFFCARRMSAVYRGADARMASCDAAGKKELRAQAKAGAKRFMLIGLLVPIALLVACKYTLFLLGNLNALLTFVHVPQIPVFKMILPVGISFYTFMALSYVLDVYWKRYTATESLLSYAVYLTYFPHVVQGPIDRFNEFDAQLNAPVAFDTKNFCFGAELALWGFFKKLVVADRIGLLVDGIFDNYVSYRGLVIAAAVALYSIQIYADFSGCIDIVSGISEMLGIRLRKNFDHPYFSRSMGEFWRRWHISLQEWFKDYVYFPVSASDFVRGVKKRFRQKDDKRAADLFAACYPILVVWLVTGIWHGADWKFVAWGLFHAALLIGSKLCENLFQRVDKALRIPTESFPWRLWQMLRCYFLCCVGRVFFRADSLRDAFAMFGKMTDLRITKAELVHPAVPYAISKEDAVLLVFVIVALIVVDIIQERTHIREALMKRNIVLRWGLLFGCILAVVILGVYGPGFDAGSFIYEQF